VLGTLASAHIQELQNLRPALEGLIAGLEEQDL
jgi:hypothetical protein